MFYYTRAVRREIRRSRALDGLLCVRNYYGCTVPTTDRAVHRCDATAVTPIEVATPYHYQWQYGTYVRASSCSVAAGYGLCSELHSLDTILFAIW